MSIVVYPRRGDFLGFSEMAWKCCLTFFIYALLEVVTHADVFLFPFYLFILGRINDAVVNDHCWFTKRLIDI